MHLNLQDYISMATEVLLNRTCTQRILLEIIMFHR